jgi:hypothetical protein
MSVEKRLSKIERDLWDLPPRSDPNYMRVYMHNYRLSQKQSKAKQVMPLSKRIKKTIDDLNRALSMDL